MCCESQSVLFLCSQPQNMHPLHKACKKIFNPSKSEILSHSSTCSECVLFNKEDHLPQSRWQAWCSWHSAPCFNLDRHLVTMFRTPLTPPSVLEQMEEMVTISSMSVWHWRYFMFKWSHSAEVLFWHVLSPVTNKMCFSEVCLWSSHREKLTRC